MKKILIGLIAVSMMATSCNHGNKTVTTTVAADGTIANANAPVIKFDKDSYNFGKIKQGDKVSYDFKFTNTGKTPLIITDAVASCGCTKPEWPKEPINPGDAGVIKVVFNSAGKSGMQDKLITITGNTNPSQNLVHLTGEVSNPDAENTSTTIKTTSTGTTTKTIITKK